MQPVVRVSILWCLPDKPAEMRQMTNDLEVLLRPGIEAACGLAAFYASDDGAIPSLSNASLWTDPDAAEQLDTFRLMLDSVKPFPDKGGTFERPIMNYLPI